MAAALGVPVGSQKSISYAVKNILCKPSLEVGRGETKQNKPEPYGAIKLVAVILGMVIQAIGLHFITASTYVILFDQPLVGHVIISTSQRRRKRPEVKSSLAQGHAAGKWQS